MSQAETEFLEYLLCLRRHITAIDYRLSELPKGYLHSRIREGRKEYCLRIYTPQGRREEYVAPEKAEYYQNRMLTKSFLKRERKLAGEVLKKYDREIPLLYQRIQRESELLREEYRGIPCGSENEHCRPEAFCCFTKRGERVRSLGEKLIADTLHELSVDYAYEKALSWSEEKVYPHFTVERSVRGKTLYWEYWGNLSAPGVPELYLARRRQLEQLGIYEGENLIVTLDSHGKPNEEEIANTARRSLLFDFRPC